MHAGTAVIKMPGLTGLLLLDKLILVKKSVGVSPETKTDDRRDCARQQTGGVSNCRGVPLPNATESKPVAQLLSLKEGREREKWS